MKTITHAGLQKTGTIDYPGILSSIIFLPGCNLRCPYCHNPELVTSIDKSTLIPIDEILDFIKKRKGIIEGVVLSGGEPLIYPVDEINELIQKIQSLDLSVKLDTNGINPKKLKKLTPNFIAMDIKTSPARYIELAPITSNNNPLKIEEIEKKIIESIQWIISSGINHEFRTTVVSEFFDEKELDIIIPLLRGAKQWSLTPFRQVKTLDPRWGDILPPEKSILEFYKNKIENAGIKCFIRY